MDLPKLATPSDCGLRRLVTVLICMNALLATAVLTRSDSILPRAEAQIVNAGQQRNAQIDEQRRTNELLARILDRLEQGPVPVRMAVTSKPAGG